MKICRDGRIWGQNNSYHKTEYKKKQREAHLGLKHWNWKGGIGLTRKYTTQKDYLYSKENLEKLNRMGKRDQVGINNPMYGKRHSDNAKRTMIEKKKFIFLGEKNPNWRGGISFLPHTPDFNERLKEAIRIRDEYRCCECFKQQHELRTRSNQ